MVGYDTIIEKRVFLQVCEKYKPTPLLGFLYRNFSTKVFRKPVPWGSVIALLCFLSGTFGMVVFDSLGYSDVATYFCYLYSVFILWFPLTFIAMVFNEIRLQRITKELGIDKREYDSYLNLYGQSGKEM